MAYLDKNKIIESLTKEDVIKVCLSLGSENYKEDKGALKFQTICHNAIGGSYKLYYYHEAHGKYPAKIFHCYTDCADSFSIFELVIRAKRAKGVTITFFQAVAYVAQITNHIEYMNPDVIKKDKNKINDWGFINQYKALKNKSEIPVLPEISENILQIFTYIPHEEFLKDNISREAMSTFEISYWGYSNQIIIPHRDKDNRLIGIRGRNLNAWDIERGKYVPILVEGKVLSHPLGENLYGININQDKIRRCKKVMIVEAEKSVLQNHSYFGDDDFSLAICGSNLTDIQINILLHYLGVEEIIIGLDKEFHENKTYEEEIYRNKIYKKIGTLLNECRVTLLWDTKGLLEYKDSPTDKGKEVLLDLLDNKIEITNADIEEALKKEG